MAQDVHTATPTATRALVAEGLGTMFLLAGVVGSGIMAETLSPDNVGVALLANAIATGAILYVLITTLGPISGAHFNPAVTLGFFLRGEISMAMGAAYVGVQVVSAILGVWLAHLMFDQSIVQVSSTARTGAGQWTAEVTATFGLLLAILGGVARAPAQVAALVAIYITAAYWFTASTSFANPAVTIARGFTSTFAGINPTDIVPFVLAQFVGAAIAVYTCRWLYRA